MTDDLTGLLARLPHRYPMLLIDRLIEANSQHVRAIKNVTIGEPFFVGHFPGRPVMPGVLIIEAIAQAAALLIYHAGISKRGEPYDGQPLLAGVDKARFRRQVVPGDRLIIDCTLLKERKNFWFCEGKASVDGELAASAELRSYFQANGDGG